ncbi:MAG: hypothetical protein FJ045_04500, partial [Crenarchaeota archaeon]|nr:hypothetical protein [Thermoproteota archaeon]
SVNGVLNDAMRVIAEWEESQVAVASSAPTETLLERFVKTYEVSSADPAKQQKLKQLILTVAMWWDADVNVIAWGSEVRQGALTTLMLSGERLLVRIRELSETFEEIISAKPPYDGFWKQADRQLFEKVIRLAFRYPQFKGREDEYIPLIDELFPSVVAAQAAPGAAVAPAPTPKELSPEEFNYLALEYYQKLAAGMPAGELLAAIKLAIENASGAERVRRIQTLSYAHYEYAVSLAVRGTQILRETGLEGARPYFDAAIDYYKRAISDLKTADISVDAGIYAECATAYLLTGQFEEAIKAYDSALELEPTNLGYQLNRSYARASLVQQQENYAKAAEAMRETQQLDKNIESETLNELFARAQGQRQGPFAETLVEEFLARGGRYYFIVTSQNVQGFAASHPELFDENGRLLAPLAEIKLIKELVNELILRYGNTCRVAEPVLVTQNAEVAYMFIPAMADWAKAMSISV